MQNKPTTVKEMWVRGRLPCTAEDYGLCSQNEDDVKEKLPFRNFASCSRLRKTNKAGAQMCCFPECCWDRPVLWVTLSVNMKSQLTPFAFLTHVSGLNAHDSSCILFQSFLVFHQNNPSHRTSATSLKLVSRGWGVDGAPIVSVHRPHILCIWNYSGTGIVVVKALHKAFTKMKTWHFSN